MIRCVAVCVALTGSCVALGQDADPAKTSAGTARSYVAFWEPFAGAWDSEVSGASPAKMVWHGEEAASGMY